MSNTVPEKSGDAWTTHFLKSDTKREPSVAVVVTDSTVATTPTTATTAERRSVRYLQVPEEPVVVPRSVRFLRDGVKAPRLHSIQVSRACSTFVRWGASTKGIAVQEEVGRALEMMRLGSDLVFMKSPQTSCNNLVMRRRTAHLSIPRVQC